MQLEELQKINEMAKKKAAQKKIKSVIDSVEGPITQEQLEEWLEEYDIDVDEYAVVKGHLNIHTDFSLDVNDKLVSQLPVQFGYVHGDFNASIKSLTTFNNFPTEVEDGFFCYDTQVASFEGLNLRCGGNVDLIMNSKLHDFTGIHKHIRKMNGLFKFDLEHVQSGGLGILLIDGVKKIHCGDNNIDKIFNKYLKKGQVFEAQEHLIDAGYAYLARV